MYYIIYATQFLEEDPYAMFRLLSSSSGYGLSSTTFYSIENGVITTLNITKTPTGFVASGITDSSYTDGGPSGKLNPLTNGGAFVFALPEVPCRIKFSSLGKGRIKALIVNAESQELLTLNVNNDTVMVTNQSSLQLCKRSDIALSSVHYFESNCECCFNEIPRGLASTISRDYEQYPSNHYFFEEILNHLQVQHASAKHNAKRKSGTHVKRDDKDIYDQLV